MSILFPLNMPGRPGFSACTMRMQNIVGVSASPFTGEQQTYEFPGEWWEADVTLPPIQDRATAEAWICFLAALRGQSGTFLLGDPAGRTPLGAAYGFPVMPAAGFLPAAGAKQISILGFDASIPQIVRAGDYFEIGRNFLLNPSAFDQAAWSKTNNGGAGNPVVTANVAAAPDGSAIADQIVFATTSGSQQSFIIQGTSTPPLLSTGVTFTFGVWLRAAAPTTLLLSVFGFGSSTTLGTATANIGTDWGYFQVSGTLAQAETSIGAVITNDISQASKTVFAYGASLDDGVSRHRLHKILNDFDSDANGTVQAMDIFPRLREVPDEAAPIIMQGARGMFRLAANSREFSLDQIRTYGISFKAIEAL